MKNVMILAAFALMSFNAFAAKTDQEVADLAAQQIQSAVADAIRADSQYHSCRDSFRLDQHHLNSLLFQANMYGAVYSFANSGSPEGNGSVAKHFEGAILVTAGEAYMSKEEFVKQETAGGAVKMALGLRLKIERADCKSDELTGELEIFQNKDNNVLSKTEFKIR